MIQLLEIWKIKILIQAYQKNHAFISCKNDAKFIVDMQNIKTNESSISLLKIIKSQWKRAAEEQRNKNK